jgi:hypothetical protein
MFRVYVAKGIVMELLRIKAEQEARRILEDKSTRKIQKVVRGIAGRVIVVSTDTRTWMRYRYTRTYNGGYGPNINHCISLHFIL